MADFPFSLAIIRVDIIVGSYRRTVSTCWNDLPAYSLLLRLPDLDLSNCFDFRHSIYVFRYK